MLLRCTMLYFRTSNFQPAAAAPRGGVIRYNRETGLSATAVPQADSVNHDSLAAQQVPGELEDCAQQGEVADVAKDTLVAALWLASAVALQSRESSSQWGQKLEESDRNLHRAVGQHSMQRWWCTSG
jgi:hypothetical protein